jgi:hypothetical protein
MHENNKINIMNEKIVNEFGRQEAKLIYFNYFFFEN